jgi:hypothetical protein
MQQTLKIIKTLTRTKLRMKQTFEKPKRISDYRRTK